MKKIRFSLSLLALSLFSSITYAQDCTLPLEFTGNTGSNMIVMLTSSFVTSLPVTDDGAYLIAQTPSGLIIGSQLIDGVNQTSLALWGNDAQTSEIDGATAGELIGFQLINGTELYDLSMPNSVAYVSNGLVLQSSPGTYTLVDCGSLVLGCTDASANNYNAAATEDDNSCTYTVLGCMDTSANNYNAAATEDDNSCEFDPIIDGCDLPLLFTGNTGSNMTVMLTSDFTSSLNATNNNAYIVALTPSGMVVGSVQVYGLSQTAIAVWANDTQTSDTDGASANEIISFQFVNGNELYNLTMPTSVTFTANSLIVQASAGISTLVDCGNTSILGCMDTSANNYNALATEDDNSCTYTVLGCMDASAFNYNSLANTDDDSCIDKVLGCLVPTAINYNAEANTDDGSCAYTVLGCMDETANNYNQDATESDDSCLYTVYGCTVSSAFNYNPQANENDGSCLSSIYGCTDFTALNYLSIANVDDGNCVFPVYGCTNPQAFNYNELSNVNNGSCIAIIEGCMSIGSINYIPEANSDDGTCMVSVYGCMNPNASNYDADANVNNDSCIAVILGCTTQGSINYNIYANEDDGSCITTVYGCANPLAFNYDSAVNVNDGSCIAVISGCTDETALNYNPSVNTSNNNCIMLNPGCMNPNAFNYQEDANYNDGTCIAYIYGCTDVSAFNYNPNAHTDNNTCKDFVYGCASPNAFNYNSEVNSPDGSCLPIISGCTDPSVYNYNANANTEDGSCQETVYGCTWSYSFVTNYNPLATVHQMSELDSSDPCEYSFGLKNMAVSVCLDPLATNYDANQDPSVTPAIQFLFDNGAFLEDASVCEYTSVVEGCTDANAFNYNPEATQDDGSCIAVQIGCIDPLYTEYNASANVDSDPTTCLTLIVNGCTDINSFNYDASANTDDGSCVDFVFGCTDLAYLEYDELANSDDGSCFSLSLAGCTDINYTEYNASANTDDGSCLTLIVEGCTDSLYTEYSELANTDDGSCTVLVVLGCTDINYLEYDELANSDNGSCATQIEFGCVDEAYLEFNELANSDDGSCSTLIVNGCTDINYIEYDATANVDDGSCVTVIVEGCMDESYLEFNSAANQSNQDVCLTLIVVGCIDINYLEYNSSANLSNTDMCITIIVEGCTDLEANNYNENANQDNGSCTYTIYGCMDASACNYNDQANSDDDSCTYSEIGYDCDGTPNGEPCAALDFSFVNTGSNMTLFITPDAVTSNLSTGDMIGVFYTNDNDELVCGGSATWAESALQLSAFGDDATTEEKDGFNEGDEIVWMAQTSGAIYTVISSYSNSDGSYSLNGIAYILSMEYTYSCTGTAPEGCTDNESFNYDPNAMFDDGTCIPVIEGCLDGHYLEFNPSANTNNANLCITWKVLGCTDLIACNYNDQANYDDESCAYADLYYDCAGECLEDADADGVCDIDEVEGCQDPTACNFNELATDSVDCIYAVENYDCAGECLEDADGDGVCDIDEVEGCMDDLYLEFNVLATDDYGSCMTLIVEGCTDSAALNFNEAANIDDGSCEYASVGDTCELPAVFVGSTGSNMTVMLTSELISSLTITDANAYIVALSPTGLVVGSAPVYGLNQNSIAVWGDDSYTPEIDGLTANQLASFQLINGIDLYNLEMPTPVSYTTNLIIAQEAPGVLSLIECNSSTVYGCTDELANNFNPEATDDDGSCTYTVFGCMDITGLNYNDLANSDDGTCIYEQISDSCDIPSVYVGNTGANMIVLFTSEFMNSLNATDENAYIVALTPSGLVVGSAAAYGLEQNSIIIWGDDSETSEFDGAVANQLISFQLVNGSELYNLIMPTPVNYLTDALVTQENSALLNLIECVEIVLGCSDSTAFNYNPLANTDDGSCEEVVEGCTDPTAFNYNPLANTDDGSCIEVVEGCIDMLACNYNDTANTDDGTCYSELEVTVQMVDVLLDPNLTTLVSPEVSDLSYTWSLGGTVLSNQLSSLYVSENGNYTVTVSDGTCTATGSITVEGIGLQELDKNFIALYPNPAQDVLNINFEVALAHLQLQILNTMGAEVLSRTINRSEVGEQVKIHIADLPKGMYILKVYSNDFTRSIPWIKD